MPYSHQGSSGHHCVVFGCSNNQRKRKLLSEEVCTEHHVRRGNCGCGIFLLHRFPENEDLQQRWLSSINRKGFSPSPSARVCSEHFVDGKRTALNPVPMLRMGYARKVLVGRRRLIRTTSEPPKKRRVRNFPCRILRGHVVENKLRLQNTNAQKEGDGSDTACCEGNMGTVAEASGALEEAQDGTEADCGEIEQGSVQGDLAETDTTSETVPPVATAFLEPSFPVAANITVPSGDLPLEDAAGQPKTVQDGAPDDTIQEAHTGVLPCDHTYAKPAYLHKYQRQSMAEGLSPDDVHFYTGLSRDAFNSVVHAVWLISVKKRRQLAVDDQVLLTLMRLRLGLLVGHLSRIFNVSVPTVSITIAHTLHLLHEVMQCVVRWLPASYIRNSMPKTFTESGYGQTTCILDCSEVILQRPRKLMARAQTYSSYKAHNTVKFITAIAPNGYIMFVSRAYGGRASDKFIMRDCGIEDNLVRGDEVMADRGFSLSLHLQAEGVRLNVPAFTKGKSQLSESEVTATRRIASVRIHVERAINRVKTYRILQQPLPIKSKKLISKIIFVCAGLCNLKPALIKEQTGNGTVQD